MKITIGQKIGAGFAVLLAMFIVIGIVVYILTAHVIQDATEVSEDDVPSVILSLLLLDKMEKMDGNVLKYMTGKAEQQADFQMNRQAFLDWFEKLVALENKAEAVERMQKVENLFLDYVNTTEQEIFKSYDPKVEQWAHQQATIIVHQYGTPLKEQLGKLTETQFQTARAIQETGKTESLDLHTYLVLVEKTAELNINITEYILGNAKKQEEFLANTAQLEALFNQLRISLQKQPEQTARFNDIFSRYSQFKEKAIEIFRRYNPQSKQNALTILSRLEQEDLEQLEKILDKLANDKKQAAITATHDITRIVKEITYTMLVVIFIAIIAGMTISIILARSISLPLALIVRGSNLLVAGDIALTGIERTEIDKLLTRQDEIGDIGRAFDAQASYFKTVIEDIVQVSQELAKGNLRMTPQSDYRGDFLQIKHALETAFSDQRRVIEDIVQISQGLAKGNLSVTHQAEYRGDFVQIKNALETAFSNQRQVIADIVQVSQGLAEGNLRVTPQFEYQGNFAQIKNALETALSNQRLVIDDIVQVSQGLAEGNLNVTPQSEYRGDFAHIKNAQQMALSTQRQVIEDIVQVSQGLAGGKLNVSSQAIYQGDFVQIKTALETALSNLRQVIEDIVHVSQGLAEGEQIITPQAEYQGDFIQIKNALQTAASKLAATTSKNAAQDWLKTGQAQLNNLMSGEQEIVTLAKTIISFLTTYTEAQVGLFYLLTKTEQPSQKDSLQVIASYAYTPNDNIPDKFFLGEGLVGQVALEQKTLSRTHTPEEYTHIIQSSLANTVPRYVMLLPCLYEDAVKAVLEIGASHAFTATQKDFLEQVISSIGIAVNTADSRTQMQVLLQRSQRQTEELQSQSEELQSQQEEMQQINEELQNQREELENKQGELQQRNEELQSQSEELQSQSEELQTQQEELKQTNEALEERTKDLEQQKAEIQHKNLVLEKTQAEMKKAQVAIEAKAQELELASQYKSEFLANMSHELRTPLNSLLILAQLLSENKAGNLTDKQVEYAQTIHSAGSDLLTLINEILDLSKVEAGKIEVQLEDLSLSDLIEMLDQKFRLMASEKGLAFHILLAEELPPILRTDGQRLKQIINNLLSNAFKFTNQGEIKLDMRHPTSNEEVSFLNLEATKTIAISVTDTGIGIPVNKQKVIFEAFQQADGSTSRRFGGTGLGLSISRQLARLLGGELQLHSEEGKGSTFTLYLPQIHSGSRNQISPPNLVSNKTDSEASNQVISENLASQTDDLENRNQVIAQNVVAPTPIQDDRTKLNPNDKTILIIEDDRKFAKILMELAQGKGFKCILADDGRTGLQLAEEYKPNAIILDVTLPSLDGWTVMDKLKDNPDTRHIPVHFISAAEQSRDAGKMGAIGYLHKPVNMEQLSWAFQKIEQFITKTVKNLLVVVDLEAHQQKILELVEEGDIQTTLARTIATAIQHLKTTEFDCIILDMDIEQQSGYQLVEQMHQIDGLCQTPVIVYAERELTSEEEALLLRCADNLTIKAVRSSERLLDEATLFLHQVEAKLSTDKRNMLRMVHDKESILARKKVLIVDDDARNTFALATILEEKNMEVFAGNNGNEALELLAANPDISIVLMDIMMPEMDGYEATRQIRNQLQFRKLPIIALTAKAMKGDKAKCIEAGANDYLSKPVDTDKLLSLMRVWLYR